MATPQKQQSGFDCEFAERPQEQFQAHCPICLLVLREPHQVTCCGYNFCRLCIERVQLQKSPCPTCNQSDFTVFLNKSLKRSLYSFKVRCSHQKDGCQWTGELGELDKHLNTNPPLQELFVGCEFVDVECCHCSEHFERRYIIKHQIETCTRQPYMLSLLTRYIDHRLHNSENSVQEKEEQRQESDQISREEFKKSQAQLFSQILSAKEKAEREAVELKSEVRTLEQQCQKSLAKLADQVVEFQTEVRTLEQKYQKSRVKLADQLLQMVELKTEVRTLEQQCQKSHAELADQENQSTKVLWRWLFAMALIFLAIVVILAWNKLHRLDFVAISFLELVCSGLLYKSFCKCLF